MMEPMLPALPLLRIFLREPAGNLAPRQLAIQAAAGDWLNADWLAGADEATLRGRLLPFYECVVDPPLHCETVARRVRFLRFGLNYLLGGSEPPGVRLDRCVRPGGTYFQPGFGLQFWSAILQATDADRLPGWTSRTALALAKLRLGKRTPRETPGQQYARLLVLAEELRQAEPTLSGFQIDAFLEAVATMPGRELGHVVRNATRDLEDLARTVRTKYPLRERLKARRRSESDIREELTRALDHFDIPGLRRTLDGADVPNAAVHDDALMEVAGALWSTEYPEELLSDIWGSGALLGVGLSFPVAILHLRNPEEFPPWDEVTRQGLASLDDGYNPLGAPAEGYRLYREACEELRRRYRLHPLEVPDLFRMAAQPPDPIRRPGPNFHGFCSETFRFLRELREHPNRDWLAGQRDRYHFAVREPLSELCAGLEERYIRPMLNGPHGWDLESDARIVKAPAGVGRGDSGTRPAEETARWITFCRRSQQSKRDDVQLFVRLGEAGLACGLRLGQRARDAGRRFRANIQQHAELLFQRLHTTQAFLSCQFYDDAGEVVRIDSPADLRRWAAGKNLIAERLIPADSPLLRSDDLVGEIMLTFHKLLPAYRCGVDDSPREWLAKPAPLYSTRNFLTATLLDADWLGTASLLLGMKRQLILQGVPGTGKTHVARHLSRLLTNGDEERVRLVQFHPAYSYEEFVEGLKPKTVEVNGRSEVTYPVEEGVLCQFARLAAGRPAENFVLLIDELNRGNLPGIFGELLYLLEYREHEIVLPYSRRPFRLPPNLYLIGTMNLADRSVIAIDQALRRRFSFVEMPPSRAILEQWLTEHPPREPGLVAVAVNLFESLNRQLREEAGPGQQVGHSYFMVPGLDMPQLRMVWEHHIRPLLAEYLGHQPQRLARYDLDRFLKAKGAG